MRQGQGGGGGGLWTKEGPSVLCVFSVCFLCVFVFNVFNFEVLSSFEGSRENQLPKRTGTNSFSDVLG